MNSQTPCKDQTCAHVSYPHFHNPFTSVVIATEDAVERAAHYNAGKIECIDAMEAAVVGQTAFEGVLTATAVKYLFRWKHKNGVEDVKKAVWYLNRLIAHLEKQ
jgi:hypothetical protein